MMAAAVPPTSASLLPLLECVEDSSAGQSDQTDAYITLASRLNGDEGRQFLPVVVKHFARLSKVILVHISSENEELCQAALQALGFCVFHSHIVSVIPVNVSEEILSTLCNVVLKSKEKFTCTRALWVISKQNFPPEVASKKAPEILRSLESMQTREVQSILIDHESLNVIIRLLEQAPAQMAAGAECWAKLVIPLVIHSASKVRLRAAAALEMGMPLLLEKQQEVAAIVEPMMSSLLIPEMQKLFASKNEANMLKLWPLFVRLLGKLLHKGGAFINSLLYLEELGFRNSSPNIKKIAFIAWKSLIDNFALNPDILCSSKRLKLLMQPLSSIHVRTEALMLTKLEVWWYLIIKLGPNLPVNFEQVGVPLLQSTLPSDSPLQCPATPARPMNNGTPSTPRTGNSSFNVSSSTPRMNLNSSLQAAQSFSSIQVLGLEMLLHWLGGPDVSAAAAKENLQLSLEPLTHPFLSSPSTFTRHASTLISAVRDGFIAVGKLAPDALIRLIWSNLTDCVRAAIEAGNKKERQGSEILTLVLQALQSILSCDELPAEHALLLLETTIKGIPQKVLGSAAYQVANMDVLNGTPALFLILLFYKSNLLSSFLEDERFFSSLETLVSCGFCGPTSPLAFAEAVLGAVARSVETVKNRKQLLRMWSVVVNPLTDTITRTNEVNQGDALEHNFSAIYSALMFPIVHVLPGSNLPQKSMNCTWSRLYKTFARCSALVATADENVCCEELCAKISAALDKEALRVLYMLDAVANILLIVIESIDFSPYTPQFQQKLKSPRTPLMWVRKKSRPLGNLTTFHALLIQTLEAFLAVDPSGASDDLTEDSSSGVGSVLVMILSCLFTNITLPTFLQELLSSVAMPLARLFEQCSSGDDQTHGNAVLRPKLEKLATDLFGSIQTHSTLHDDELLSVMAPLLCVLFPHKNKHIRSAVANFWNASFGNASALSYPETLRSVLSQTKQRTPLILPGFESVDVPDDCSEQFTNECSQLDPQISGVKMSSVGNRGSLVKRAEEPMERGSASKPVSVKLDFGSSKPLRQGALEEESSVDFVFIPPETKERVLTEHQKEVKRSKRVDIPALYNNLDASLDTTVFTQFSQSQDESVDASVKEDKDEAGPIEAEEQAATTKETLNDTHSLEETPEKLQLEANLSAEQVPSPSSDGLTEQKSGEQQEEEENSPNVSSSSDVVSGTPPVANSRRQSFITLEKYVEGQAASPVRVTFTGPLSRTSKLDISSTEASPHATETPKSEEVSSDKFSDSKEDVVPDTQNQVSNISSSPVLNEESAKSSPADDSQSLLDSQSSQEPRRSGRRRSKPQRPGQEAFVSPPKNASQDQAQNDKDETNSQTPKLPTDGTLTGRRLRTKIAVEDHLEGQQSPGKVLRKGSSQTDSQSSSAMSEELGQADSASMKRKKRSETLLSDSESDSQQTGRTLRSRALAASQKQDLSEKTSTDDQKGNKDQTNSDQAASSKGPNETPDSSQSQTRYRTRRSKGLVADSENSESRDDEKPKKRPRKSKTPDVSDSTEPSGTQTELNVTDVTASSELSLGRTSQDETDTQTATDISHSDMELHQGSTSEDPPEDGGEEHNISEMVADVDGHSVDVGEKDEGIKCSPQNESSPIKSEQGQKRKLQRRSRSRGRRRSKNTPQTEQSSLSEDLMDSQSSQSSFISVSEEIKSSDGSSEADVLPISGTALEAEASESATTKLHSTSEMKETDLELSKSNEELEEVQTKLLAGSDQQDRSQEEESESSSSPNIPVLNPLNDSSSQGPPAEEAPLNQDLDSHTLQEDVMKDMEDQTLPEHKNEENAPLPQDSNETEIPKDIGAKQDLEMDKELPVSVHDTAVEASNFDAKMYLDSPPKPKLVDVIGAELDSVLSPSRRASYGWSPSASPSTSILKKGQKRSCEEDTPSPCLKSRRVSFATPIYHQELADDIDRRSPVIRTSSPRSKVLSGQSKFITTPTKARSGLSPRALHSPGHRSSKKCLISEMSQEPRPVAKDCVYPPLVGCSTPIEAVLPQLTFNMWSRGFGQLIRARNIKTVGDLSGLTPSEIKSFPFRSPKLSNVKKALKRYHEQQKGRCDELKSFDEMEKMTSEPEETEFPQNQDEEQSPEEMLDVKKSELSDEDKADSLFSDTTALAGRYTPQELLHCSPEQLSLMHENLVGMMRSIMVHVQSRLQSHHADTLP